MNVRIRSLGAASALALLMAGCLPDPTQPTIIIDPLEPIAFEAVSANGRPLPALLTMDGATSAEHQLTRASLVLSPPDSLRLILVTQPLAESGAAIHDTLRARLGTPDSVIVLSPMGSYPLRVQEQMVYRHDGTLILTVAEPLPSSGGAVAARPVELHFRAVEYRP